jgi:hypothetical protein
LALRLHRHHLLHHYDEEGVVHPWTMGLCGNLYQFLSCASLIRVTWAAYHDCDHIYITHMMDLLLLRWFMRCKFMAVLDVLIGVYVTPFLYAWFWSNLYTWFWSN